MTALTDQQSWDAVPQIETDTVWKGGPGGPANSFIQALANRTAFLKAIVDALSTGKQDSLGFNPINKDGDSMAGALRMLSGIINPGNTNNCGQVFSGDNDTGHANPSDGVLQAVVNGLIAAEFTAVNHERKFNFGPGNAWRFAMQGDGNVVIYDAGGSVVFSSTSAASQSYVQASIAALVASSPAALDTLNELATALGNDPNFATTITNALAGKQPALGFTPINKAGDTMTGTLRVPSGLIDPLNSANVGLTFSGDGDSGICSPSDGSLALVVNGQVAFSLDAEYSRTFRFGPSNGWSLSLQLDGNVVVYNDQFIPVWTSNDAVQRSRSNSWAAAQAPVGNTLVDGASIAWDCSTAQVARLTIAGNRSMAAPTNVQQNALYLLRITQDATGSRSLSWNAGFKFGSTGAPTLTTTAGKTDLLSFVGGAGNTLEYLGIRQDGV